LLACAVDLAQRLLTNRGRTSNGPLERARMPRYRVMVDDNFHYMDVARFQRLKVAAIANTAA